MKVFLYFYTSGDLTKHSFAVKTNWMTNLAEGKEERQLHFGELSLIALERILISKIAEKMNIQIALWARRPNSNH